MALQAATSHIPSSNEVSLWVTVFLSEKFCFVLFYFSWFLVCLSVYSPQSRALWR